MAESVFETVSLTTTASAENIENTQRPTSGAAANPSQRVEPCGQFAKEHVFFALVAIASFIAGSVFLSKYLSGGEENEKYVSWVIGMFFSCFSFGALACLSARQGFNPSVIWGAAYGNRLRSGSRGSSVTQDDIEGQVQTEPEAAAENVQSSGSYKTASLHASFADEESCKVTTVSEVASAVVKIAKQAAKEVTTAETEVKETEATAAVEKQVVEETSEAGQKSESESELTSSGEVRRRIGSRPPSDESDRSSGEVKQSSSDEEKQE